MDVINHMDSDKECNDLFSRTSQLFLVTGMEARDLRLENRPSAAFKMAVVCCYNTQYSSKLLIMTSTTASIVEEEVSTVLCHKDYRIALYYAYVPINDVEHIISLQQELCRHGKLCGRIRISPEGINGVLSGSLQELLEYQAETTRQLQMEQELDIKYCLLRSDVTVESQLFFSLSVKATRQVVSLYDPPPNETKKENNEEGKQRPSRKQRHQQSLDKCGQNSDKNKLSSLTLSPCDSLLSTLKPAIHLSPNEWNAMLLESSSCQNEAILVDARNTYESRVGHFQVNGIPTLLTNTRKYSYLPQILEKCYSDNTLKKKRVFMYCTGGVRCEQASVYLQSISHGEHMEIYQLDGGIQRYLQEYGRNNMEENQDDTTTSKEDECLYYGKNFVFDLRRTDPVVGRSTRGACCVCNAPHDDYDNGHAPCQRREARCCKCRVLVLCCNECRSKVQVWGQEGECLPKLYCGGLMECIDDGNCIQPTII